MEVLQTLSKELISDTGKQLKRQSNHTKHYGQSYNQKRLSYLLKKQQEYRLKKQSLRFPKNLSSFQQKKTHQLLRILVNQRSFVPVPPRLKHPIIKNGNADNYGYKPKLDLNNLERGCVRILKDNGNNCAIIGLDIDCKKWTKLAKLLRCGYITSPKGHIRIPVPIRNLNNGKTGILSYQGIKIGDAKLSGEVMLPNNAYYDKQGNFLGFYRYKAWGTFFPLNNKIWDNSQQFFTYLTEKSRIEYLRISEHLFYLKNKAFIEQKNLTEMIITPSEISLTSALKPPGPRLIITSEIVSQNRH